MTTTEEMKSHARDAEQKAARWLYLGNRASDRGNKALAERHYSRSQRWHDQMNILLGNGCGEEVPGKTSKPT